MPDKQSKKFWYALAGAAAGVVNGFFGGGGGQVLVPLLAGRCGLEQRKAFATSVAVIAPLCALSAGIYWFRGSWTRRRPCPTWRADWRAAGLAERYSKGCPWCGCAGASLCSFYMVG